MRQIKDLITRVTNLENSEGYTLPVASGSQLGGIKVGENLTIEEDGTLNAQAGGGGGYTLPTATDERLGGIKVGENLTIEEDGTLNATGGGGGGSSFSGNIARVKSLFTLSNTGGSIPVKPSSMTGANHYFSFVDIYKIQFIAQNVFNANIQNISDSSDTMQLEIQRKLDITNFVGGVIRLYADDYQSEGSVVSFVSSANGEPMFIYEGPVVVSFTDTNSKEWVITGTASLNFSWDMETGHRQVGNVNISMTYFSNITDQKYYKPNNMDEINYFGQSNTYGTDNLYWFGYYVY